MNGYEEEKNGRELGRLRRAGSQAGPGRCARARGRARGRASAGAEAGGKPRKPSQGEQRMPRRTARRPRRSKAPRAGRGGSPKGKFHTTAAAKRGGG